MNGKLGLGTAQFGSAYGITNRAGRPAAAEIARIVERALETGIDTFDTAAAYGESETILGQLLPAGAEVRVVTKTIPIDADSVGAAEAGAVADAFMRSLERLRRDRVDTLLVHDAGDLAKPGGELLAQRLADLRDQGLVGRLGASIYEQADLAAAGALPRLEVVQAPLNLLDRRLIEAGVVADLGARGIALHVRSVFLQGLLLTEPGAVPAAIAGLREPLARLDAARAQAGLTRAEAALGFVLAMPEVEVALVGANSEAELAELIAAAGAATGFDPGDPGVADPNLLDPRRWPPG